LKDRLPRRFEIFRDRVAEEAEGFELGEELPVVRGRGAPEEAHEGSLEEEENLRPDAIHRLQR
jgi:hypothetical protein